jgi:glycosyltransferase involved in cell wall biosynthesis
MKTNHELKCEIVYLVGQLRHGGLERQLYYLLSSLDRARYNPVVVVWNLNPSEKYYDMMMALGVPIYGYPLDWPSLSKLWAFSALIRQLAPKVIHSYSFHTNFAAHYAALGTSALAIGSVRGDFARAKSEGGSIRGALNARWPPFLISNSQASADVAKCAPGLFRPRKVFVVRNGLDVKQFRCVDNVHEKRQYVAAVGSLFPVKRWDRLLRVVQRVKMLVREDIHFRIAGDGPLRPLLEKQAENLGISQAVELLGVTHDIPAFLRGAKVLVHTSESEGCPNAVMEAMACSLPVVAMETGDIPYLVDEGTTGFVVQQGDEMTLAERISTLLGDATLRYRMGMAARAKAEREFGLDRLVSETLATYKALGWKN